MTTVALSGAMQCAASPERVEAALHDPAVLRALIPACRELTPVGPGLWTARIETSAGPVPLRLAGRLSLQKTASGALRLRASGGSFLAGDVTLALDVVLTADGAGTVIRHDGRLEARGLTGRLLQGNETGIAKRVQERLEAVVRRLDTA